MAVNQELQVGNYRIQFDGLKGSQQPTHFRVEGAFRVFHNGVDQGILNPALKFFPTQQSPIGRAVHQSSLSEDIYLILSGFSEVDRNHATLKVLVRPLVVWMWIGGFVIALGTLVCIAPLGKRVPAETMLGHKGDLMLVHFRKSLDALNDAELTVAQSELYEYLDPSASYLSVVELGLYGASLKLYSELTAKGVAPRTGEWNREVEAKLSKQRDAAAPRLWPEIPQRRYLCFYPMNKFRGETKNWYSEPIHAARHNAP